MIEKIDFLLLLNYTLVTLLPIFMGIYPYRVLKKTDGKLTVLGILVIIFIVQFGLLWIISAFYPELGISPIIGENHDHAWIFDVSACIAFIFLVITYIMDDISVDIK